MKTLLAFILSTIFLAQANADALDDYVTAFNSNKPMPMMPQYIQDYYNRPRYTKQTMTLQDKYCENNKCFAKWKVESKWNSISGWLLSEEKNGKIITFVSTTVPPSFMEKYSATIGQTADSLSSITFLVQGGEEANPLGPAIIPLKYIALRALKNAHLQMCLDSMHYFQKLGWGAAIYSAIATASGGVWAIVGGVVAYFISTPTESEKFWACALEEPSSINTAVDNFLSQ